jgi:small neutral amino acid transporter SnatA (MarC family)
MKQVRNERRIIPWRNEIFYLMILIIPSFVYFHRLFESLGITLEKIRICGRT